MFRVTGLKFLGWIGRHTIFFFFRKKYIILSILNFERPFKMHFSRKTEKKI